MQYKLFKGKMNTHKFIRNYLIVSFAILLLLPQSALPYTAKTRVPDMVKATKLIIIGKNGSTIQQPPDRIKTSKIIIIGKGGSTKQLPPDMIKTARITIIGKKGSTSRQPPDRIKTTKIIIIGKGKN